MYAILIVWNCLRNYIANHIHNIFGSHVALPFNHWTCCMNGAINHCHLSCYIFTFKSLAHQLHYSCSRLSTPFQCKHSTFVFAIIDVRPFKRYRFIWAVPQRQQSKTTAPADIHNCQLINVEETMRSVVLYHLHLAFGTPLFDELMSVLL